MACCVMWAMPHCMIDQTCEMYHNEVNSGKLEVQWYMPSKLLYKVHQKKSNILVYHCRSTTTSYTWVTRTFCSVSGPLYDIYIEFSHQCYSSSVHPKTHLNTCKQLLLLILSIRLITEQLKKLHENGQKSKDSYSLKLLSSLRARIWYIKIVKLKIFLYNSERILLFN